ncbi:NAD binding domain of 6-phosphogluconate dehydrogenase-domain-containing protein [Crassisporium funariophilum]|nr:NAD binding domain of 6-phosphogluconate dehydrogenase-domain-containing protein [Crassisporium funariophilum]
MRSTVRCLQASNKALLRTRSTSFIGLGRMGYQMAYNLFSKQYIQANDSHFVVCDAIPDSALSFRQRFLSEYPDAQLSIANTPEEAALVSSQIITMLPSSPQVKSVYSQAIVPTLQRIHANSSESTLCIDSTTLDVDVAREVASSVINAGAQMIDAPVSGGVTGAKAGTLSFLVGGTEEAFLVAHPLLSFMGQRIIHCGPSGAGLAAKICNNLVLGVQQIVVAEAMLLGQALGLEPSILASVINSSTGSCWASSVNNPVPFALPGKSPPCEREYEGGFATALMLKDMGLASEVAQQRHSPLPLGEAAKDIYSQVIQATPELANKDFSSVYRHLKGHERR